ncbi:MAG: nucleotide exchange factor GrpE [bacterium]|nr:nucleotide exchange factor GrpE [bacterium]
MPKEKKLKKEERIIELTAAWQRAQADFANLKRQTELDQVKLAKRIKSDLILEILPVLDNFQLAAKHVPTELENNNWAQGVKQIEKQFESILTSAGLEKIQTIGQQFDHNLHEAIESVSSEQPEGEVVEELQAGYQIDSNVIRPAKVKVSRGK